jgi:hypothetical protein
MLQFIREHNFNSVYLYIGVALHIFLYTPSTNYSVERSFSTLKKIKKLFSLYNGTRPVFGFSGINN